MSPRAAAYIGVGLAAVCLWLFVVYLPLEREQDRVVLKMTEMEKKLAGFVATAGNLPDFLTEEENLKVSRTRLQSSLPTKDEVLDLLRQVNAEAEARHLVVMEVIPPVHELISLYRETLSPEEPNFLNITFVVRGSYRGFGKFIGDLERAVFFRGINSCRISGSRDLTGRITYSVGFKALLGEPEELT